jgi:hypothetical protein
MPAGQPCVGRRQRCPPGEGRFGQGHEAGCYPTKSQTSEAVG